MDPYLGQIASNCGDKGQEFNGFRKIIETNPKPNQNKYNRNDGCGQFRDYMGMFGIKKHIL